MPDFRQRASGALDYARSLLRNKYFWGGIASMVAIVVVAYLVIDRVVMPEYTRQGESIRVPNVLNQPYEQAQTQLQSLDLEVERVVQRYNASFPRDVVIDQNPPPDATVKPGRYIYITVNSGELQRVAVPDLEGLSLREAVNRLQARGLQVDQTLPDTVPAPNRNTVTRQRPAPGDSLTEGSNVTLWYSTGLGEEYATLPDVAGMSFDEARRVLLQAKLRSIAIGIEGEDESELIVQRQSPQPGTQVRTGFEVRLYADEETPTPPEE